VPLVAIAAYLTAMRRGDLMRLTKSDLTDEGIEVAQGKTGKKQLFTRSSAKQANAAKKYPPWPTLLPTSLTSLVAAPL